jgi:hypothetical protein
MRRPTLSADVPSTQCAAVSTQSALISEPPQK